MVLPEFDILHRQHRSSYDLLCFLLQDVHATMECFENLFTRSYARMDGTCPLISPQTSLLHTNALLSWALLLTICTANQLKDILRK